MKISNNKGKGNVLNLESKLRKCTACIKDTKVNKRKNKFCIGDEVECSELEEFKHPIAGFIRMLNANSAIIIVTRTHESDDANLEKMKGVYNVNFKNMIKLN